MMQVPLPQQRGSSFMGNSCFSMSSLQRPSWAMFTSDRSAGKRFRADQPLGKGLLSDDEPFVAMADHLASLRLGLVIRSAGARRSIQR
jgi:hypothetical protein